MQRHVLHCLALRMNWMTGRGFASTSQLADDADASRSTVIRSTKWAVTSALLLQTRRGGRLGNGQVAASEWQLIARGHTPQGVTGDTLTPQGVNGPVSRCQQGGLKVSPGDHHQESSTSRSSSSASRTAAAAVLRVFPGAREDEIEKIVNEIKNEYRPRDLGGYITAMAEHGDLRLPCDTTAPGRYSQACRYSDGHLCVWSWCCCRCHVTRVVGPRSREQR